MIHYDEQKRIQGCKTIFSKSKKLQAYYSTNCRSNKTGRKIYYPYAGITYGCKKAKLFIGL